MLSELHWLRFPECIQLKVGELAHCCLHGKAPAHLVEGLHGTTDIDVRRRLRSADATSLLVPLTRQATLGDRAFSVAAPRAWNNLPQ